MKNDSSNNTKDPLLYYFSEILSIVLVAISIFSKNKTLASLGFFLLGCNNLYQLIKNYKTKKSIDYFALLFTLVGFILSISTYMS